MSHLRVKTTYEVEGAYGSTEIGTLYCHHNNSCDIITFYTEDGEVANMCFQEWSRGKDMWDAMIKLWSPFKDSSCKELQDGVEYYYIPPWEISKNTHSLPTT